MRQKIKDQKNNPVFWFIFTSILGYTILIIRSFLSKGEVFGEVFASSGYFSMSDTLMHLQFVFEPEKVYFANEQACFPAFAYIFYYLITRIVPSDGYPDMNYYRSSPIFNLIYLITMIIICCILVQQIQILLKDKVKNSFLISILILLSEPFWGGAIERGNAVLIALVLLMCSLIYRESRSKVKKEIALIMIAMAAGFKIYPAIMGLIYIIEKRYKEAMRLVLYGIAVFLIPFAFFGGIEGFCQFIHNLTMIKGAEGSFNTVSEVFYLMYKKLSHNSVIPSQIQILGTIFSLCFFVIAVWISFMTKKTWVRFLFLCSVMIVFVPASYPYTTIYLLIPFVYFLREQQKTVWDNIYAVLFGMIFSIYAIPSTWFINHFEVSLCFVVRYLALYSMLLVLMIKEIHDFIRNFFEKRKERV